MLVRGHPLDRRAREADQRHVVVVQRQARGVELVPEGRASGAGAKLVVGPVHDVVGQELRAAVEELLERLLPVLGVEHVLLLDRDPGKLAPLLRRLAAELGMLGLELRDLLARRLPLLPGANPVLSHSCLLRLPVGRVDRVRRRKSSASPRLAARLAKPCRFSCLGRVLSGATVRALRPGPSPQLTIRSGWIRISGVGRAIASPRPRTSIPRGRQGSVLASSSITIAARPAPAPARNFFLRSGSAPPTSILSRAAL